VDFDTKTITVTGQLGTDGNRVPAKTTSSSAPVPLLPALERELHAHRSRQAELLMGALVGRLGVSALFIGLILGVAGSKIGSTYRMLFVAPMLGVAAGLGAFTAYDW
jgi:hypothetical protein